MGPKIPRAIEGLKWQNVGVFGILQKENPQERAQRPRRREHRWSVPGQIVNNLMNNAIAGTQKAWAEV